MSEILTVSDPVASSKTTLATPDSVVEEPPRPDSQGAASTSPPPYRKRRHGGSVATALLSTLTTVLVSFIGIVPQLRTKDAEALRNLQEQYDRLNKSRTAPVDTPTIEKTIAIKGAIKSRDVRRAGNGWEVLLLPQSQNYFGQTDDTGAFTFQRVPDGTYSIVIRDPTSGASGRGLLDPAKKLVEIRGAAVEYEFQQ